VTPSFSPVFLEKKSKLGADVSLAVRQTGMHAFKPGRVPSGKKEEDGQGIQPSTALFSSLFPSHESNPIDRDQQLITESHRSRYYSLVHLLLH
jgi:hypothetical protein